MAKTSFMLRIPGCEITDIDACRNKAIGVINDAEFENFLRGLEINRLAAVDAPKPRGGEASVGCRAESGGGWSCGGSVSVRW